MHPKYIIVTQPHETRGLLRMGMVINHKDLVIGYEKVHGGGWWMRDDEKKEIVLYVASCDYGSADFRFLNMIPKEFEEYTFYYTPYPNIPPNKLDLSEVKWI